MHKRLSNGQFVRLNDCKKFENQTWLRRTMIILILRCTHSLSLLKIFWNSSQCTCKAAISGTSLSRGRCPPGCLSPGPVAPFLEPAFLNESGRPRQGLTSLVGLSGSRTKPSSWKENTYSNYYCRMSRFLSRKIRKNICLFGGENKWYNAGSNSYFHFVFIF